MDEKKILVVWYFLEKNNITITLRSTFSKWYLSYFLHVKPNIYFGVLSHKSFRFSVFDSGFSQMKWWKACEVTLRTSLEMKFMWTPILRQQMQKIPQVSSVGLCSIRNHTFHSQRQAEQADLNLLDDMHWQAIVAFTSAVW